MAKHKETWAPSPVLGELAVPPRSSELLLFLGSRGCGRAGEGADVAGQRCATFVHLHQGVPGSRGKTGSVQAKN